MSLKENKYIRYFGGHDKRVVTLAMNPADDTFLSGSLDKSIRLWDLRSNHCQVNHHYHYHLILFITNLSGSDEAGWPASRRV